MLAVTVFIELSTLIEIGLFALILLALAGGFAWEAAAKWLARRRTR